MLCEIPGELEMGFAWPHTPLWQQLVSLPGVTCPEPQGPPWAPGTVPSRNFRLSSM